MEEGALYWATYVLRPKDRPDDIPTVHVVPLNDTRTHDLSEACWCQPTYEVDDGDVYIHTSADGREDYEAGFRKPH